MAVSLLTFADSEVTVKRKETFLTRAFNEQGVGKASRGVYRGFNFASGTFPTLNVNVDPVTGDSVAIVEIANGSEKYSLTVRRASNFTLDLTAFAGQEIVVAISATYSTTSTTVAEIKAFTVSEYESDLILATGSALVVLGTVRVPDSGAISLWDGLPRTPGFGAGFTVFRKTFPASQKGIGDLVWVDVVRNGSFEQGQVSATYYQHVAQFWNLDTLGGGSMYRLTTANAYSGGKSLAVYGVSGQPNTGDASQWLGLPVVSDQVIRLAARIRVQNGSTSGSLKLFLEWGNDDNATVATTELTIPTTSPVLSFNRIDQYAESGGFKVPDTVTAPSGARFLKRIGIRCTGLTFGSTAEHVFIDDFHCFIESKDSDHRSSDSSVRGATAAGPLNLLDPSSQFSVNQGVILSYDASGNQITASTVVGGTTKLQISQVTGLVAPTTNTDAANKQYVDSVASGLIVHHAVKYATNAVLSPNPVYYNGSNGEGAYLEPGGLGNLIVDGTAMTATDVTQGTRILVKDQADPKQNGIYVVTVPGDGATAYKLTRATDATNQRDASDPLGISPGLQGGSFVMVMAGSANSDTGWVVTQPDNIFKVAAGYATFNVDNIVWAQFSKAGILDAGAGLVKTGNANAAVLDVELDALANAQGAGTGGTSGLEFDTVGITGKLRAAVAPTGGLSRQTGGLGVLIPATGGLQTTGSGTSIKINATGGLTTDASGAAVLLDPSIANPGVVSGTLVTTSSGTKVAGLPAQFNIAGSQVGTSVTATNLTTLSAGDTSDSAALHTHTYLVANDFTIRRTGTLSNNNGLTFKNLSTPGAGYGSTLNFVSIDPSNVESTAGYIQVRRSQAWTTSASTKDATFEIGLIKNDAPETKLTINEHGKTVIESSEAATAFTGQTVLELSGETDFGTPVIGSGPALVFTDSSNVELGRVSVVTAGSLATNRYMSIVAQNTLILGSAGSTQIGFSGNELVDVASTGNGPNEAIALNALAGSGQVPQWNGANWVPVTLGGGSGDITDVNAGNGISVSSPGGPAPTVSLTNNANLVGIESDFPIVYGSGNAVTASSNFRIGTSSSRIRIRSVDTASSFNLDRTVGASPAVSFSLRLDGSTTTGFIDNLNGGITVLGAGVITLDPGATSFSIVNKAKIYSTYTSTPTFDAGSSSGYAFTPSVVGNDTRGTVQFTKDGSPGSVVVQFNWGGGLATYSVAPKVIATLSGATDLAGKAGVVNTLADIDAFSIEINNGQAGAFYEVHYWVIG